jgi:hypothetical protein
MNSCKSFPATERAQENSDPKRVQRKGGKGTQWKSRILEGKSISSFQRSLTQAASRIWCRGKRPIWLAISRKHRIPFHCFWFRSPLRTFDNHKAGLPSPRSDGVKLGLRSCKLGAVLALLAPYRAVLADAGVVEDHRLDADQAAVADGAAVHRTFGSGRRLLTQRDGSVR